MASFIPDWASPSITIAVVVIISYISLCRLLRHRYVQRLNGKYGYHTRANFAKMTVDQAFEIQSHLYQFEFPFIMIKGLQFALFKTYGVPTISKVLLATKQLSERANAPRRYTDTETLIAEVTGNKPDSLRANQAMARMNFLHSSYRKAGLITNDDMLYTLILFATEPTEWVEKYEWRSLTALEVCAQGTFWKSIGDAMQISYEKLPSSATGWTDGLHWYEEANAWAKAYELEHMVPHKANKQTADETTAILFWDIPNALRPYGSTAVAALLDSHVRKAMMYAEPPSWVRPVIDKSLRSRAFLLRHFALPRPSFLGVSYINEHPNKHGRYNRNQYVAEPWYIPDSFWFRNDMLAWLKWLSGSAIPGTVYKPEGYLISEVGPVKLEGKGGEYMKGEVDRLMSAKRGGCPFAFA